MGVQIDTHTIDLALKQMAGKEKKVRNKALQVAAKAFAQELRKNTPTNQKDTEHLKDDIKISKIDGNGEIFIGYGKETAWRAHFVELGTIKQMPQGFIQRTEREMQSEVMKIMRNELRKGLGL
ncbi:HK97-gp10 family putative phage morphogenesis protein [Rummeliibacillus stabekisii]|uniref:HK97-gp10 family putative phage morphogenesis protein n=1 Tax=Rummeliibacillus stabekisii TaxID=241244 RepID=UPI003715A808